MASPQAVKLVEVETGQQFDVEISGLDVFFPNNVRGWADVLDCRIAPFSSQTVEENCEFADTVRKKFVLVASE